MILTCSARFTRTKTKDISDGTGRDEAVNRGIVEEAEEEAEEEADDETVRIWKRFDQLVAKVKMRRTIAFGFEEDDDYESDIEDEPTTSRVEVKKIERDRKLNVPKNWRMSADGIAVPAEHRRGLRSIFIPGRVWFGNDLDSRGARRNRDTRFRVLFWDEERGTFGVFALGARRRADVLFARRRTG